MNKISDKEELLQDVGVSLIGIAFWAAACFGVVWLFPEATWVWVLFVIYAALTLLGSVFDFGAKKALRRLVGSKRDAD